MMDIISVKIRKFTCKLCTFEIFLTISQNNKPFRRRLYYLYSSHCHESTIQFTRRNTNISFSYAQKWHLDSTSRNMNIQFPRVPLKWKSFILPHTNSMDIRSSVLLLLHFEGPETKTSEFSQFLVCIDFTSKNVIQRRNQSVREILAKDNLHQEHRNGNLHEKALEVYCGMSWFPFHRATSDGGTFDVMILKKEKKKELVKN